MFTTIIRSSVWNMNTEMPPIHQTNLVTRGLLTKVVNKEVVKTPEGGRKQSRRLRFVLGLRRQEHVRPPRLTTEKLRR